MSGLRTALTVGADDLRHYLVGKTGLAHLGSGSDATTLGVLGALGMIQLDPIDRFGASPDLVVHARVHGHHRGRTIADLQPGHTFEHYAKELCLLPARDFSTYRALLAERPSYRHGKRVAGLPPGLLDDVEAEIRERGPTATQALQDRGAAIPQDWSGWKGTGKQATLAVRALWLQCRIVPVGRAGRSKIWDLPERALTPGDLHPPTGPWKRDLFLRRVAAAGLLPTCTGPWWGGLRPDRDQLIAELVDEERVFAVRLPGSSRTWLCLDDPRQAAVPEYDDLMRVIAPLDPLIWDRVLTERIFDFRYVWEIYKPKAKREWGYYVCPLLHQGRIVGRFEAHRGPDGLIVDQLWREHPDFDEDAWRACLARLDAFQHAP